VAQGEGPEFKPQYYTPKKKKKRKKERKKLLLKRMLEKVLMKPRKSHKLVLIF
jgi:membrane carboxypeptidase/penicillin-binding protein